MALQARNKEHSTEWVCVDCLFLFANGETPTEKNKQETREWLDEIDRRCAGYNVTLGLVVDEHAEDCPNVVDGEWVGSEDCDCEQKEFSWSQCDTCGSGLGGSRDAMTFWKLNV